MPVRANEQIIYVGCNLRIARRTRKDDGTIVLGPKRDIGSVSQIPNAQFNTQSSEFKSPRWGGLATLDKRIIEQTENYPINIANLNIENVALAFGGTVLEHTQAATEQAAVSHFAYPDSYLELRGTAGGRMYNISRTGLAITAGATPLVEGEDFILHDEGLRQGVIQITSAAEAKMGSPDTDGRYTVTVTFTPEAMSGRRVVLPRMDTLAEFEVDIVYPENGAYAGLMREGVVATIEPNTTAFNQREVSTVQFTVNVLGDPTNADEPYGRMVAYKGDLAPFNV